MQRGRETGAAPALPVREPPKCKSRKFRASCTRYALRPASGIDYTDRADFPYTIVDEAYAAPGDAKPYENDQVRNDVALGALFNPRGPFRRALVESGLTLGYNPMPMEDRRASVVHVMMIVAPGHTVDEVRSAFATEVAGLCEKFGLDVPAWKPVWSELPEEAQIPG